MLPLQGAWPLIGELRSRKQHTVTKKKKKKGWLQSFISIHYFPIFFGVYDTISSHQHSREASTLEKQMHHLSTVAICLCVLSRFSRVQLCDPMDCSPPGSSVHGILQAKILEWVAMPSSRGIFLTQGSNLCLFCLLHWQSGSLPLGAPGKPSYRIIRKKSPGKQLDNVHQNSNSRNLSYRYICTLFHTWWEIIQRFKQKCHR